MGLSPRTRGNPEIAAKQLLVTGPIPASAGEPIASAFAIADSRAYPRERGGTK